MHFLKVTKYLRNLNKKCDFYLKIVCHHLFDPLSISDTLESIYFIPENPCCNWYSGDYFRAWFSPALFGPVTRVFGMQTAEYPRLLILRLQTHRFV